MDTNTYNCIIIDTYTDIYPILVAGRALTLTHLVAKDNLEHARLVVVIVRTPVPPSLTTPPPRLAASYSEAATPPAACVPSSATSTSPEAPARLVLVTWAIYTQRQLQL